MSKRSWRVGGWLKFFLGGSLKDKARVILMNAVRAILSFFEKKGIEVSHKEVFLLHSFVILNSILQLSKVLIASTMLRLEGVFEPMTTFLFIFSFLIELNNFH